jgi:SAM-dependent methyltransferase
MNAATAARLLQLNRDFYVRFGAAFSATRRRVQPGVGRFVDGLRGDEAILDLGCGNGELARSLTRAGHRGAYLGLDFSPPLLEEARRHSQGLHAGFLEADVTQLSVIGSQLRTAGGWDVAAAFAVLHHIPGEQLRAQILGRVRELLAEDGRFVLSNWQFLGSARLRQRLQPWAAAGLHEADVDPGDHLLDWRSGGQGLRYVHQFSEAELARLAHQAGMRVCDSYLSDGEGGKLSLYQVWTRGGLSISVAGT